MINEDTDLPEWFYDEMDQIERDYDQGLISLDEYLDSIKDLEMTIKYEF